jgi:hypothetical protein
MLYGRLDDNNNIVEIIDQDPAGRYAEEIVWVTINEDYGLLTTRNKNKLLEEIKIAQSQANEQDFKKLSQLANTNNTIAESLKIEREKLEANDVDVEEVYRRSLLTQEERDAEDAAAAEAAAE